MGLIEAKRFKAKSDDGSYETTIDVTQFSSSGDIFNQVHALRKAKTKGGLACEEVDAESGTFRVFDPAIPGGVLVRIVHEKRAAPEDGSLQAQG